MYKLVSLLVFLLVLAPAIESHEGHDHSHDDHEPENSDVLVLTDATFDDELQKNEFMLVEFYAPWCGHCIRLAPEYEIVATTLKGEGSNVAIAKVDSTQNQVVSGKYGIRGFPTLKFFRNGNPVDYEGGRTAPEMMNWIKKKSGPATHHITSKEAHDSFTAQQGIKVLALLSADSDNLKLWNEIASTGKFEDFPLGHITDSALYGEHKADTVVILKPDEEPVVHSGAIGLDEIVKFINDEGYPLVEDLAQKVWQRSQASATPLIAFFHDETDTQFPNVVKDLAKKFKGKILTTISAQKELAERWGTSGKKFPTGIFVKWANDEPKMTIFDEESESLTADTAETFINKAMEGTYKTFRKSEPIPADNSAPVKILVGKNFDEIVLDKSKDVFVEFYAPWCGHCKKLAPVWDELGESFEDVPNVVVAKMDATANSPPEHVDIRGFPTLVFFPADNKEGVVYNGDRDLDSFKKFVKEHASYSKVEL